MTSFYYDLILSGLTYVLLIYLSFTLMRRRKKRNDSGNNDGGLRIDNSPQIDLPPGVTWPDGSGPKIEEREEEPVY